MRTIPYTTYGDGTQRANDDTSNNIADKNIPTDTENNQLLWDGNYTNKILGLLNETNKHCVRKGLLQPFIKHDITP